MTIATSLKIIFVVLLGGPAALAQTAITTIKPEELGQMFWDGMKVTQLSSRHGLMYIETRGDWVLTVETDRLGSSRAKYVNAATGTLDSECVVIGDSIYERSGNGPWKMRTRAVYDAEQAARTKALNKARAEKDPQTYERIRAAAFRKATFFAINGPHAPWFGQASMNIFAKGFLDETVITASGREILNGRSTRMYKITGVNNKLPPTVRGTVLKNRHENDYWFDEKTGAIVKARTRRDEFRGDAIVTDVVTYEWELDPQIQIKAPVLPALTMVRHSAEGFMLSL